MDKKVFHYGGLPYGSGIVAGKLRPSRSAHGHAKTGSSSSTRNAQLGCTQPHPQAGGGKREIASLVEEEVVV